MLLIDDEKYLRRFETSLKEFSNEELQKKLTEKAREFHRKRVPAFLKKLPAFTMLYCIKGSVPALMVAGITLSTGTIIVGKIAGSFWAGFGFTSALMLGISYLSFKATLRVNQEGKILRDEIRLIEDDLIRRGRHKNNACEQLVTNRQRG